MYNIGICEDEKGEVEKLIYTLKKYEKNEGVKFNIDCFESGEVLIKEGYEKYHIIFMDVQMNKLTGIETAKVIRETNKNVKIFFITSMEKYWGEGYKVSAYRYTIKPIDEEIFYSDLKELLSAMNKEKKFISVNKEGALTKILISEIIYMEIVKRKVDIYTKDDVYSSSFSIDHWNSILKDRDFVKPHNSYLVNLKHVIALDKEKVTLTSGHEIYMSKRKYKEFKDSFTIFLGNL